MWIINTISSLFRLSYRIFAHLIITINRWVAFSMHLTMMFFVWNSLLIVIGIVRTAQMTIGFGYDVSNLTHSEPGKEKEKEKEEKEEKEKPETYWQKRRKVYQEMIDNLYVKYMERLVEIQQDQSKYWQFDQNNYIYPQPRYDNYNYYDNFYYEEGEGQEIVENNEDNEDNGETSSDASGGSGDNNTHLFIPPIKITEDTSMG